MASLDEQEGVARQVYKVVTASVETPEGNIVKCRTYQLVDEPPKLGEGEGLPDERKPSKVYLDTIIKGAVESGLPEDYIQSLKGIPHNGYDGQVL